MADVYIDGVPYDVDDKNIAGNMAITGTLTVGGVTRLNGDVGIGISPAYKFSVGSADGSDQVGIYHDNTDAYMKWDDGSLNLITDEGVNTNTFVNVKGKGTGRGFVTLYDQDNLEYLQIYVSEGTSTLRLDGTSLGAFNIQDTATTSVNLFSSSVSGQTKELNIYGYRASDSKRSLEIGVGVDAADTASFDGVSNYYFDGALSISEITTPTATANKGKIYTKTDNKIYFQDGAGTEHEIAFA